MSKEAAMAMATGQPVSQVNPSLITGEMTTPVSPELTPGEVIPENAAVKGVLDSDRFAMIAKKEARLVKERESFKKEMEALSKEKEELRGFHQRITAFEEKRKSDPLAALKDIGFSETEIFNFLAAQEKKEPTVAEIAEQVADKKLNGYKEEQEKIKLEAQKTEEATLISTYKTQIASAIKANPEKYEYANFYGTVAEELAMEFARENVKVNGDVLSPDEIAQEVENYYEEADKAMSQLKKRQPKIETQSVEGVKAQPERTRVVHPPQTVVEQPKPTKTLTNRVSATVASTIVKSRENSEQKRERLMNALRTGVYQPK